MSCFAVICMALTSFPGVGVVVISSANNTRDVCKPGLRACKCRTDLLRLNMHTVMQKALVYQAKQEMSMGGRTFCNSTAKVALVSL